MQLNFSLDISRSDKQICMKKIINLIGNDQLQKIAIRCLIDKVPL